MDASDSVAQMIPTIDRLTLADSADSCATTAGRCLFGGRTMRTEMNEPAPGPSDPSRGVRWGNRAELARQR